MIIGHDHSKLKLTLTVRNSTPTIGCWKKFKRSCNINLINRTQGKKSSKDSQHSTEVKAIEQVPPWVTFLITIGDNLSPHSEQWNWFEITRPVNTFVYIQNYNMEGQNKTICSKVKPRRFWGYFDVCLWSWLINMILSFQLHPLPAF